MFNFPLDALPPSPATEDPTLQSVPDPLTLPASDLEDLGLVNSDEGYTPSVPSETTDERTLDCQDLEQQGLWETDDCCDLCHSDQPIAPFSLHYKHVTVRGCCHSHHALNYLHPPPDDFIARLFR